MITGTVVPVCPAPGDTDETAAGGGVAIAEPVSDAVNVDPPGAEFVIVTVPVRVGLGVIDVGVKLTKIKQEVLAAITPVVQLVLAW
jgi:hypothetical protein